MKLPEYNLHDQEIVFNEPWEAEAFALTLSLYRRGLFTWDEWANTLGSVIHGEESSLPYYQQWLLALGKIISSKGILTDEEVSERCYEWEEVLKTTPHGKPLKLPD